MVVRDRELMLLGIIGKHQRANVIFANQSRGLQPHFEPLQKHLVNPADAGMGWGQVEQVGVVGVGEILGFLMILDARKRVVQALVEIVNVRELKGQEFRGEKIIFRDTHH